LKLAGLKGSAQLNRGALLAHATATLPGIVAAANQPGALRALQCFKQRQGPFLLLAANRQTAARLVRYYAPELRRQLRAAWPGPVTLLFPGRPGLPACCYHQGMIAVRVDASLQVRQMAAACGGLLVSSSLNRRGAKPLLPDLGMHMRWRRFARGRVPGDKPSGQASRLIRVRGNHSTVIRR